MDVRRREIRLCDSQWVAIVNSPRVLGADDAEEAVAIAVRMTEEAMALNFKDDAFPPPRQTAEDNS